MALNQRHITIVAGNQIKVPLGENWYIKWVGTDPAIGNAAQLTVVDSYNNTVQYLSVIDLDDSAAGLAKYQTCVAPLIVVQGGETIVAAGTTFKVTYSLYKA